MPHFDPAEAGVRARVLFILEAPGPMTNAGNRRPGSGFISVDNNDGTAANIWALRNEAGLHEGALHWNIVPWYLGAASRKPTAAELKLGGEELAGLLPLLSELRVVVLCGRAAQRGWKKHVAPCVGDQVIVIETWHPSPLAMNQAGKRAELKVAVERAAAIAL
ncbi:uracil-DNA glycosylase [Cryobacterium sp. MLB-32]|uniref:uracil-DNA glycosylase n=1 Tax=Cryobacterium sp. MLB-32 TaxID=1529318 RepID=UPI001E51DC1D|nr:uracil-DNA glycosylase [Cryobacterium sp. MLB-32]